MREPLFRGTPFWININDGLFVHNPRWIETLASIPPLLSSIHTYHKLQRVDQILQAGISGYGVVGDEYRKVTPDYTRLQEEAILIDDHFSVENLFLQWVYQFSLIEGISVNFHDTPLPEWPDSFSTILEETLHSMAYISGLILLYEEGEFKSLVTKDNFSNTQEHVQDRAKTLIVLLNTKCFEYGESFRRHGVQGMLPRLWDKVARYAQLSALGRSATHEPKLDSIRDLMGYCLIAWSLIHEVQIAKGVLPG